MRVATLNVWAHGGDWPARRAALADGFRALDPDLIALQETVVSEGSDQVREILGDGFEIVHSRRRSDDGTGISIASRHPVVAVEEVQHEPSARDDGFPCTTLVVHVEPPDLDAPVAFANHFPSWQPQQALERERQAVEAAARLEPHAGHAVVAGDFDAEPESAGLRFWTGRQSLHGASVCYRDAWERIHPGERTATFTPEENPLVAEPDWPFRHIDHVLVRCGVHGGPTLPVRDCRRIFDDPPASDHFGLLAELG